MLLTQCIQNRPTACTACGVKQGALRNYELKQGVALHNTYIERAEPHALRSFACWMDRQH